MGGGSTGAWRGQEQGNRGRHSRAPWQPLTLAMPESVSPSLRMWTPFPLRATECSPPGRPPADRSSLHPLGFRVPDFTLRSLLPARAYTSSPAQVKQPAVSATCACQGHLRRFVATSAASARASWPLSSRGQCPWRADQSSTRANGPTPETTEATSAAALLSHSRAAWLEASVTQRRFSRQHVQFALTSVRKGPSLVASCQRLPPPPLPCAACRTEWADGSPTCAEWPRRRSTSFCAKRGCAGKQTRRFGSACGSWLLSLGRRGDCPSQGARAAARLEAASCPRSAATTPQL